MTLITDIIKILYYNINIIIVPNTFLKKVINFIHCYKRNHIHCYDKSHMTGFQGGDKRRIYFVQ